MNVFQEVLGITALLEEWTVDWLRFFHLTSDPWIQLLMERDWRSTAAGPIQDWHSTLRRIYSTTLLSFLRLRDLCSPTMSSAQRCRLNRNDCNIQLSLLV
jgi:hypothetical protein